MYWIAFFSQTGGEINNIRKHINRDPDLIITNRANLDGVVGELVKDCFNKFAFIPQKPTIEDYKAVISHYSDLFEKCFITLHGYLRIIPEELCNNYDIYNLHPGLITKYPFLKGFNPQEKAFSHGLPTSGAVIHKVVAEVDSGEILKEKEVEIKGLSLDEIYTLLHSISTKLWCEFFADLLQADVWSKISSHQGETFRSIRGLSFTYTVHNNYLICSRTTRKLSRSQFEKAQSIPDLTRLNQLKGVVTQGNSYVFAIITDPRIKN